MPEFRVMYHGCIVVEAKSEEEVENIIQDDKQSIVSDKNLIEGIAFDDLEIEEIEK